MIIRWVRRRHFFNNHVEATIGVYINYLSGILVDCGVPPDNTTLDKRLTEPLWQTLSFYWGDN